MNIQLKQPNPMRRDGVTLIELMVVVSIMAILTAMMIPRLRIISQDRNIREAARIAASVFASASQRAASEGAAGVIIERNPNLIDSNGVYYGGTALYTMRAVPPYIGDSVSDRATKVSGNELTIPKPLEYPSTDVIAVNDFIRVNHNSIRYRIDKIFDVGPNNDPQLKLTLSLGEGPFSVLPPLPGTGSAMYPFVIHRQPRKVESSRIDLPEGYLIDTRFSGPINYFPETNTIPAPAAPRSWFHEKINPGYYTANGTVAPALLKEALSIKVIFNANGQIDLLSFYNPNYNVNYNPDYNATVLQNGFIGNRVPVESLYFFIAPYEIEPAPNHGVLNAGSNLWVTVNNSTGGVNVGYNTPPPAGTPVNTPLGERIIAARNIAAQGQSAAQ